MCALVLYVQESIEVVHYGFERRIAEEKLDFLERVTCAIELYLLSTKLREWLLEGLDKFEKEHDVLAAIELRLNDDILISELAVVNQLRGEELLI